MKVTMLCNNKMHEYAEFYQNLWNLVWQVYRAFKKLTDILFCLNKVLKLFGG